MRHNYLFTSESVTEGHPDKIADQISDGILDALIAKDKYSRVACETILTTGIAFVAGEISTKAYVEIPDIIREVIKDVGYCDAAWGFDYHTCSVLTAIHQQSGDISMGVDSGGAGDQGLMFGYATNETTELMPMPIVLAHRLTKRLAEVRKKNILPWVRPDGKSQVTVEYRNGKPVRIDTIVVSTQHSPDVTNKQIERDLMEKVIKPMMPKGLYDPTSVKHHINPTGRFVVGGPHGRHRTDGPQDHRRHLWRSRQPWRRRLFRQGSHEGGPVGLLHGPLHRKEHRRRRVGPEMRSPARLRDRRGRSRLGAGRHEGHGKDARSRNWISWCGTFSLNAARHYRLPQAPPADLQKDRGLRALRPK